MTDGRKLLVWDETGAIHTSQEGGVDSEVIERYEEVPGQRAAFFDIPTLEFDGVFIHRDKLRHKEPMGGRLDKDVIRPDGQDEAHIMGIPAGAQIHMTDGLIEIVETADGTTIPFVASIPSKWVITISHMARLQQQFEIIVK